jgi:hypothetical protein
MVDLMAREFPDFAPQLLALRAGFASLPDKPAWRQAAYSAEIMPRSLRLMREWPEMKPLQDLIDPPGAALAPQTNASKLASRER